MFIVLLHELLFLFAPCSQFIDTCLNPFLKRKLLTTCSYFTSISICRLNHYAIGVKILSHSMSCFVLCFWERRGCFSGEDIRLPALS